MGVLLAEGVIVESQMVLRSDGEGTPQQELFCRKGGQIMGDIPVRD